MRVSFEQDVEHILNREIRAGSDTKMRFHVFYIFSTNVDSCACVVLHK